MDLSKPALLMTFQALGPLGYSGQMGWEVPWQSALAGRHTWLQAAWLDSRSKVLSLTSATHITLPTHLPAGKVLETKIVYWPGDLTSPSGFGPVEGSSIDPITRYCFK